MGRSDELNARLIIGETVHDPEDRGDDCFVASEDEGGHRSRRRAARFAGRCSTSKLFVRHGDARSRTRRAHRRDRRFCGLPTTRARSARHRSNRSLWKGHPAHHRRTISESAQLPGALPVPSACRGLQTMRSRVLTLLPDPTRPVVEEPLADPGQSALYRYDEPRPDLLRREYVAGKPILDIYVSLSPPVVSSRIPDREAAVDMSMDDEPGIPWSARLPGPTLVQGGVFALIAQASSGRGRYREAKSSGLGDVGGPSRVARAQARVQIVRPPPRQRPPGHVEQKTLAESVVAGDEFNRGARSSAMVGAGPTFSIPRRLSMSINSWIQIRSIKPWRISSEEIAPSVLSK